jgi:hypothetical protein
VDAIFSAITLRVAEKARGSEGMQKEIQLKSILALLEQMHTEQAELEGRPPAVTAVLANHGIVAYVAGDGMITLNIQPTDYFLDWEERASSYRRDNPEADWKEAFCETEED